MGAARVIEAEWLDELPHADARARRSRRDLVRVNALMGNARIVAAELAKLPALRSVAEIGAGDGAFMRAALRRLGAPDIEVHLVDRQPLGTVTADVFDWLADPDAPRVDAIVANLFLHHFDDARIARLFALAAGRTRAFIACEPRRSAVALAGARLLGVVGCNDVTRHDAVVSVRAGFSGRELTGLWPLEGGWRTAEGARGLFSHAFVARADG
jgi:hypothetical protein